MPEIPRERFLGTLGAAALLASCSGAGGGVPALRSALSNDAAADGAQRITRIVNHYFKSLASTGAGAPGEAKGFVVGVTQGPGKHSFFRYGDLSYNVGGARVGKAEDALFFVGSNSKVFTAILLALAIVEPNSAITLDTPVRDLLPTGVSFAEPHGTIRLWHLATHSAGYPDGVCGAHTFGDYSFPDMTAFLAAFTPPYAPGKLWSYSNPAFALLGVVVANVLAGGSPGKLAANGSWPKGYRRYFHQVVARICAPLGMTSSGIQYHVNSARVVQGYTLTNSNAYQPVAPPDYVVGSAGLPAGALSSTPDDMLTFLDAHMGMLEDETLRAAMMLALTPASPNNALDMGLGWQIAGPRLSNFYFQKNGGLAGYSSAMAVDPRRKWGIVVLSNTAGNNVGNELTAAARFALGDLRRVATPPSNFPQPAVAPECP